MSPVVLAYAAGVATLPVGCLLLAAGWVLFHRGPEDYVSCTMCPAPGWRRHPNQSRLPWWVWSLSWRRHKRTRVHRAACATGPTPPPTVTLADVLARAQTADQ